MIPSSTITHPFTINCEVDFLEIPFSLPKLDEVSPLLFKMFNQNSFPDCVVKSSTGFEFKVHKAVLALNSEVFNSMFANQMKEGKQGIATLEESDQVLKELFRFFYCGEVKGLSAIAPKLLVAANKYLVDDLKTLCAGEIVETLNVENALKLLIFANQHNCGELEEYAVRFIAR